MNALVAGDYTIPNTASGNSAAYGLGAASNCCWPNYYTERYWPTQTVTYQCCSCGTPSAMRAAGIEMLLAATMASLKLPKGSEEGKRMLAAIEKLREALSQ